LYANGPVGVVAPTVVVLGPEDAVGSGGVVDPAALVGAAPEFAPAVVGGIEPVVDMGPMGVMGPVGGAGTVTGFVALGSVGAVRFVEEVGSGGVGGLTGAGTRYD